MSADNVPPPIQVPQVSRQSSAPTRSPSTAHSSSGETGDRDIVPPYHPARTLVLCFDGTGDSFGSYNSNIITFFSLLKKDDRHEQMVYYQPGIGTYLTTSEVSQVKATVQKVLDEMVAWNLGAHVMAGYEFLMQNYQEGDKICLFGFSRGAYTARALAGMLHKVGLLPACNHQQVPFAYKMYSREDEQGWAQSTAFKKAFSIDVDIDFIGVWDTVSSVGVIPHTLPFTSSNKAIRVFRQALSLDERRARFKPALYIHPKPRDKKHGTQPGDMPKSDTTWATQSAYRRAGSKQASVRKSQRQHERDFNATDPDHPEAVGETDVYEVWFAGNHCDVGGGNVTSDVPHSLSRIPLRWMIRECFKMDTGIRFHGELLRRIGMDPAHLHPRALGPAPVATEEEYDARDAVMEAFDELVAARREYKEERTTTMNLGRGRLVPKHHSPFHVHRSVKMRMEAEGLKGGKYLPKAKYAHDPIWVD
ncbi:uncharacterized protein BXZ73DRAFT_101501 [Epithele typhae]|uniref:uncharacterized protein n=1 Tax=Epithele typhae TaxID=378194 RepID=UPI0020072AB9|nr:uncharacterized protein BXZ73DRAFT_101501 [Epithele typhae]KAH9932126.1 hypothetical protein BXZ73DRAFT_101501 [Epithele typhae]